MMLFGRILLIEDDSAHALLIRRALAESCREVVHLDRFTPARARLSAESFDLIITDLHLPDTTGVTHVEELRAAAPGVPVIVLTASTSIHDAVEAMKSGARDFIVKTFDQDFREILGFALTRLHAALVLERDSLRLQRDMELLRIAIENSHDGLAVISAEGRVEYSNSSYRAFARRCGGRDDDLLTLFGDGVAGGESLRDTAAGHLRRLTPGSVWHTEVVPQAAREEAYDLSLSVIRRDDLTGQRNECVVWVRDRSEQKRREQFQREILSTTTHDLKGPLGAILLSTELLSEDTASQSARELVLRIASSAQGAINLIDEFLSARRLQEGTFILRPMRHNLVDLLRESAGDYAAVAAAKQITLAVPPEAAPPVWGCVDRLGFLRVVGNLLSNAIKFSPRSGSVEVTVGPDARGTRLAIRDTGTGMEPVEARRLFERFSRLERHGEVPGSGLGLFVVRSIVTAHGGSIEVTSRLGEGSTFAVVFPQDPPVNERGELISLDFA